MPSYLKDTKDTIHILNNILWNGDGLLATADVALLYTCFSHSLGFEAGFVQRITYVTYPKGLNFGFSHVCYYL